MARTGFQRLQNFMGAVGNIIPSMPHIFAGNYCDYIQTHSICDYSLLFFMREGMLATDSYFLR